MVIGSLREIAICQLLSVSHIFLHEEVVNLLFCRISPEIICEFLCKEKWNL